MMLYEEEEWFWRKDRWKERGRCLKLRLRYRFRVAVDKHRRQKRSGGFVLERWIRHFQIKTNSTSTFYPHKKGFFLFLFISSYHLYYQTVDK